MAITKLKTVSTNIPGLDTILGGGIPAGSLIMLVGAPGTGKTILLQQLAFAWVRQSDNGTTPANRKALYFSTLSEPHDKLIQHLSSFTFFDETLVPAHVELLSLSGSMNDGLDKVTEVILDTVRHTRAGLVVIDSFAPLAALATSSSDLRQFLYLLSAQVGILNATTLISIERSLGNSFSEDELALADGLIGLYSRIEGVREFHRVEVRKLRGLQRLQGLHTYQINEAGLTFYPRLEALVKPALDFPGSSPVRRRLDLGLPELETMLGGGIPDTSSTILAGSLGAGKTLLSLYYLMAGAKKGQAGYYVGFHESSEELLNKADRFNLGLREAVRAKQVTLLTLTSVQIEPDIVIARIQEIIQNANVKRFVLDGFAELERICRLEGRSLDFTAALVAYLKERGITALYTHDISKMVGAELDFSDTPFMRLAENLVLLRQVEYQNKLYRILSILKMRDSNYDRVIREFTIDDQTGINILGPMSASVQGLLTGSARSVGAV